MTVNNHKISVFSGVGTAIITPFSSGKLDLACFSRLVERQAEGGVSAVIVAGTTGEAPTLTEEERTSLTKSAKRILDGKIPLILGCGANDTERAKRYAKEAEAEGADALLAVTPYYNKGTESGNIAHFFALADSTELPLILYNVPSRTGVDLTQAQYEVLFSHPRIVGVKEAKSDIEKLGEITAAFGETKSVYTGNDLQFLPALSLGADGVISVTSNLFPKTYVAMYQAFCRGDVKTAERISRKLFYLTKYLFAETNPAPLKYAMAKLGLSEETLRLPLGPVTEKTRALLDSALGKILPLE